ncbi:MAG: SHOCT domain-containing protein [Bacteroidaceae bacterium]|nr:SHOCT domain-containing protein [Bacteroidaceae bacterium]
MKTKIILSSLVLLLFSFLAAGSNDNETLTAIYTAGIIIIGIIIGIIMSIIQSRNESKRRKMIKEDEENSTDFDRRVSIGDDRCKLYFDASKKQVMIMRITTEGIDKKYVDDFEFPGKKLAKYNDGAFFVYEPKSRKLLCGTFDGFGVEFIGNYDKYNGVVTQDPIEPIISYLSIKHYGTFTNESSGLAILIDEHHGFIAAFKGIKPTYSFNYIKENKLPEKKGLESRVSVKSIGNYMFIMDNFFKVLVLMEEGNHNVFNYFDIIDVSYEENGNQLFSKSTGRTVGGAIVGGMLMGGAGAVVGGLSGDTKQNKEVKSMDIKILLHSTEQTSYVLHFMASTSPLKTKETADKTRYDEFLKNANQAKDLLSIIIDDAKRNAPQIAPVVSQPVAPKTSSIADELTKLAKLRADGILTEEEFQTQKAKLLG